MILLSALMLQTPAVPAEISPPAPPAQVVEAKRAEAADAEKVVCRTREVTGSFARRSKSCKTNREWARQAEAGRDEARKYVDEVVNSKAPE